MQSPFGGRASAKRINLSLSDRDAERLANLVDLTNASSQTEVIKRALLTYEALVLHLREGARFYIMERADSEPAPLNLLIDVEPKRQDSALIKLPVQGDEGGNDCNGDDHDSVGAVAAGR